MSSNSLPFLNAGHYFTHLLLFFCFTALLSSIQPLAIKLLLLLLHRHHPLCYKVHHHCHFSFYSSLHLSHPVITSPSLYIVADTISFLFSVLHHTTQQLLLLDALPKSPLLFYPFYTTSTHKPVLIFLTLTHKHTKRSIKELFYITKLLYK